MKQLLTFALLLACTLSYSFEPYKEDPKGDKMLNLYKTYYITQDKAIVDKTIKFINDGLWDEGVFDMRYKAFFSELFTVNPEIKAEVQKKLPKIKNANFYDLFEQLLNSSVEDIYTNAPTTVDVNEMLVYSYYADGNVKYLVQLLEKSKDTEERVELDKFMIGWNAIWWLATIKVEDAKVNKFLEGLPNDKYAVIAFKSRAYDLKNEQLKIMEEQKKNKIWK
jgi:hypothetical protein